jgi:signal transduction histidine kinase
MSVVQERHITGSLVLVDDITERRSREARLHRMENLASLTTLAAGIAHEIKNPLGSLSIHIQLIQKAMAVQEKLCVALNEAKNTECEPNKYFKVIDRYLEVVNEEIDRLNGIVVDFLFAVRPMNVEFRRADINAFIKELAEFVSFELKDLRIECTLDLAENLPAVDFDEGLMKQALLNLIKNAEAAMDKGGLLNIATEDAEGEIRIIVTDTGTGISEDDFPKIFEPYFTTKESGTGLGLTAVFKIVKEHHGEINVRSREGEGTVFTITLPKPQIEQRLLAYQATEVHK